MAWTKKESELAAEESFVATGPMTVRELVERLRGRHHYGSEASARGSIFKWAGAGVIEGVELERRGRPLPALVRLSPKR